MSSIQNQSESKEMESKQIHQALNIINQNLNNRDLTKPYLIGISGGSASGKTTVAQKIFKELSSTGLKDCVLISMDSYYKPLSPEVYKRLAEYNFDHPNAFDFDLIAQQLNDLLQGKEINMPVYNFKVSKREQFSELVKPANLVIFEGIMSLYDRRIRNLMDMKIFVDTDDDVRLARRIYRDIKERGRQLENIIGRYHKYVKPCFDEFIKPTRKMADVIIPRGAENSVAIDLVSQHLKYQLSKRFAINQATVPKEIHNINIKLIDKEGSNDIGISSKNELFDPKYQFYDGKVLITEDEEELITQLSIFEDFMNGNKTQYYKMFIDYLINNLMRSINYHKHIDTSYSIFNCKEVDVAGHKENILYFSPTILSDEDLETFDTLVQKLNKESLKNIHIASIFLSPTHVDLVLNKYKDLNINFSSLYFSDNLIRYQKYIISGGVINDEGNFSSEYILFNRDNFVEFFKKIWLKYLDTN